MGALVVAGWYTVVMALNPSTERYKESGAQDLDGRVIVVGPGGVALASGGLTNAELRAAGVEVLGRAAVAATGSIAANGSASRVAVACAGMSGGYIRYSGTYGAGPIMVFEVSLDGGANYQSATATYIQPSVAAEVEGTSDTLAANADRVWIVTIPPGATHIATYCLFGYSSGSVDIRVGAGTFKAPNAQIVRHIGPAHDGVNTGETLQVGGHATGGAAPPTVVASGDRARQWMNTRGAAHTTHSSTDILDGRLVTVTAGTRVAFPGTVMEKIIIQALEGNTGKVVVGDAATVVAALATRRGIALAAGERIELYSDVASDIGLDSMVNAEGVSYVIETQ